MTLQLNEIASLEGKITKSFRKKSYYLKTQQKLVIKPNTQEVSKCILAYSELPEGTCAVVEPLSKFEKQTGLCVTSSLAKLDSARSTPIGFLNVTTTNITVPKDTKIAKLLILTPKQASYIQPLNPELLSEHLNNSVNELVSSDPNLDIKPSTADEFWFPTPETCADPRKLTGISKQILMNSSN